MYNQTIQQQIPVQIHDENGEVFVLFPLFHGDNSNNWGIPYEYIQRYVDMYNGQKRPIVLKHKSDPTLNFREASFKGEFVHPKVLDDHDLKGQYEYQKNWTIGEMEILKGNGRAFLKGLITNPVAADYLKKMKGKVNKGELPLSYSPQVFFHEYPHSFEITHFALVDSPAYQNTDALGICIGDNSQCGILAEASTNLQNTYYKTNVKCNCIGSKLERLFNLLQYNNRLMSASQNMNNGNTNNGNGQGSNGSFNSSQNTNQGKPINPQGQGTNPNLSQQGGEANNNTNNPQGQQTQDQNKKIARIKDTPEYKEGKIPPLDKDIFNGSKNIPVTAVASIKKIKEDIANLKATQDAIMKNQGTLSPEMIQQIFDIAIGTKKEQEKFLVEKESYTIEKLTNQVESLFKPDHYAMYQSEDEYKKEVARYVEKLQKGYEFEDIKNAHLGKFYEWKRAQRKRGDLTDDQGLPFANNPNQGKLTADYNLNNPMGYKNGNNQGIMAEASEYQREEMPDRKIRNITEQAETTGNNVNSTNINTAYNILKNL